MKYDEGNLRSELAQLGRPRPGCFGYLVAQRLSPLWRHFAAVTGWEHQQVIENGLQTISLQLGGLPIETERLLKETQQAMSVCPRMNDWPSDATSFAIYGIAAVHYSLLYLHTGDIENIVYIGRNQYEAVEEYASVFVSPEKSDDELLNVGIVQKELEIQGKFLQLASLSIDDAMQIAKDMKLIDRRPTAGFIW